MVDRLSSRPTLTQAELGLFLETEGKERREEVGELTKEFFQGSLYFTLGYGPDNVAQCFPTISPGALERKRALFSAVYPQVKKDFRQGLAVLAEEVYRQRAPSSVSQEDLKALTEPLIDQMAKPQEWLRGAPEDRGEQFFFEVKTTLITRTKEEQVSKTCIWDELMVIREQLGGRDLITAAFIDVVVGNKPDNLSVEQERRHVLARHIAQLFCQRYKPGGKKLLPEERDKGYVFGCKAGEMPWLTRYSPYLRCLQWEKDINSTTEMIGLPRFTNQPKMLDFLKREISSKAA